MVVQVPGTASHASDDDNSDATSSVSSHAWTSSAGASRPSSGRASSRGSGTRHDRVCLLLNLFLMMQNERMNDCKAR